MKNRRALHLCWISSLFMASSGCSGAVADDEGSATSAELTSAAETSEASTSATNTSSASASATATEGSTTSTTDSATASTSSGDGDGDTDTGIECTPELTGYVPGCPCLGVTEGNPPPYWCGNGTVNVICEEATQTCTLSETCDVVSPEPEPNDDLPSAVDLGTHCGAVIAHGQLQPGDVDWFTWQGMPPTSGCGSRAQASANNPNIDVCIYEACIDDIGTMSEGFCMGAQTEDNLGPNTAGCCGTSFARDPENTIDCQNGQVWMVRVESTASECMAYELEMG